jgi:hypothetical protein
MTTTTLSSLIDSLQQTWSQPSFESLLAQLYQAQVGVLASKHKPDEPIQAMLTEGETIALSSSTHGDGKRRVVACADPQVFFEKFGPKLNAVLPGQQLMNLVLENDQCHGIILNSATSATSISIGRDDISRFVQARSNPSAN